MGYIICSRIDLVPNKLYYIKSIKKTDFFFRGFTLTPFTSSLSTLLPPIHTPEETL